MSSHAHASPFDPWLAGDPEILSLLGDEEARQSSTLQLIASENFTSTAVLAATGSVLTNKYAEGYPGRRYYGGNQVIDEVEDLARQRLKTLFGAAHANVQPHAGSNANLAAYQALIKPGDTVLAMRLDHGGHLTHGSPASITSKIWNFVSYGVSPATDDPDKPGEIIDFDQVADLARTHRPQLIVAGSTAYARIIDPMPFREIADSVGARFLFDAAHPAGLIAGGVHPSPVGVADVVTFTTHKTLRGPRGGAIVCTAEHAKAVDSAIFPGLQGGPLENVIAAKAVAFAEAARPEFRDYSAGVVANAKALAAAVAAEGIRLVSGGTENHQVLCDLQSFDAELTGKEAQEVLDRAGITCNRNTIPDDPRSPFVTSGLRLGTAALTTTGMGTDEMARVGALIGRALRGRGDDAGLRVIRAEVRELCAGFPPYPDLAGA
jgi:glycine hydroxymethyltransferase